MLLHNIIGALAIFFWSLITSLLLFGVLKYFKFLRVSKENEFIGLDIAKHKEPAYPSAGWCTPNHCKSTSKLYDISYKFAYK